MYHVPIDASPAQLSKLKRGHPVRIKQGCGFNLLVHPETYNIVARAFAKGKGAQIALSHPELLANAIASSGTPVAIQNPQSPQSPTISGSGIFGDLGDKYLKKAGIKDMAYTVGNYAKPFVKAGIGSGIFGDWGDKYLEKAGIKDMAYTAGDYAKPFVKAGIGAALTAGGVALGAVQPELIPGIPFAVAGGTALASDFLDHPQRYLGESGVKGKELSNMAQQQAHAQLTEQLNSQLGTNMDYLRQAGLANVAAQQAQANMNASSVSARQQALANANSMMSGEGFHRHMRQQAITGRGAGMIASSSMYVPPALASQPFSSNYQFKHFFPPQYQGLIHGNGHY